MIKQKIKPSREPLSRLWLLSRSYTPIDQALVHGRVFYMRVEGKKVSILDAYGRKGYIRLLPNEKSSINSRHTNFYYYLNFRANGRSISVPIALLVVATFKHQIPDRSKGEVIDHIDGDTLNNNPRNLRIVTRPINDRDAGFMRKLRNNGIRVSLFSGIILEGYERLAKWKETHTPWQYRQLKGDKLKQIFVGPSFRVVDPGYLMDLELNKYAD